MTTSPLNTALLRLPKRAEASGRDKLIKTFVDVGPLFTLLSSPDHQVVFGRRGTGKTHALTYLADDREAKGDAVAIIDLRNVGSSGGMYADETIPLSERATRLLVDTLNAIHDALIEFFVNHSDSIDLAVSGPALDAVADAITQVQVVGQVERETRSSGTKSLKETGVAGAALDGSGISLRFSETAESLSLSTGEDKTRRSGVERLYVNFGATGAAFRGITEKLSGRRLWILLDEWSSVPYSLQPYLADLVRRSLFSVPSATVKIGAIEQRSQFRVSGMKGEYIGIELGADASADINLDDFMVFDNNAERAKSFFEKLIARHVLAVARGTELAEEIPASERKIIKQAFTEKRALEEFVRACEGVPRDAINILALAAQRALSERISVQHVRVAAHNWYQRDKEKAASANEEALELLHWVIDAVIGERRARAFLLASGTTDSLIEDLYDSRVLHLLKKGISTHDQPGVRYDVYKLDMGAMLTW